MDDSLHDFIRKAAAQGQSGDQIERELLQVGWELAVVQSAMRDVLSPQTTALHQLGVTQQTPATKISVQPQKQAEYPQPTQVHHNYFSFAAAISVMLFVVFGGGAFYYYSQQASQQAQVPASQYVQEKTPVDASDLAYVAYTNDAYNFSMNIPQKWSTKEFSTESFGGEKRIAFGTSELLPTELFSAGDYAWIKIYSTSLDSSYKDFAYLNSLIGKDPSVNSYTLGGESGVGSNEFIAVEHKGKVYELHLIREPSGGGNIDFSQDSQEMIRTFTFTNK